MLLKFSLTFCLRHGIISQRMEPFITTAMRTPYILIVSWYSDWPVIKTVGVHKMSKHPILRTALFSRV
jgi:hypothetical protein